MAAAGLYLALALWTTGPLWVEPRARIQSLGDPLLNSYILWWAQHALFHQIWDFFQANVFWPHADALAYGEHLLAQALMTLPVRAITTNAVALHTAALVEGYWFSALGAYALAWAIWRRWGPALVAGLVYGFALYRIVQVGHVQLVHGEFLPLAVLAFERTLRAPHSRWKWGLGAAAWAQWMTSWYWAVFSFWVLVPYMAVRLAMEWRTGRNRPGRVPALRAQALAVVLPLVVAGVAALPMAWPYIELRLKNITVRPAEASDWYSARPKDWLAAPGRAWLDQRLGFGSAGSPEERRLFPGLMVSLGMAAAMTLAARRIRGRSRGAQPTDAAKFDSGSKARNEVRTEAPVGQPLIPFHPWLWIGLTFLLLSFTFGTELRVGPNAHDPGLMPMPYALVEAWFPFAEGIRVAARWMLPAMLGVAMLVAWAWKELLDARRGPAGVVVQVAVGIILLVEHLASPLSYVPVEPAPPEAIRFLAEQRWPSPVVELPLNHVPEVGNRPMLHATWHLQPTINGTNGFFPPGQIQRYRALATFPSREAMQELVEARVRFVVVDLALLDEIFSGTVAPGAESGDEAGAPMKATSGAANLAELEAAATELTGEALGKEPEFRRFGRYLVVELPAMELPEEWEDSQ